VVLGQDRRAYRTALRCGRLQETALNWARGGLEK
jgi:hypothetical protein